MKSNTSIKKIERSEKVIKFIQIIILLIPMSFLFHYIETSNFTNAGTFAFTGTFVLIVLAGVLSVNSKLYLVFLTTIFSIILSIVLGGMFITPPNEAWFNPFGMNFAIVFVGIIILIGILIVHFIANRLFKNREISTKRS